MPGAIWRPVNAHGGPMLAHRGLVLHVQVGNGSCYGLFNDPGSQASSTWWVGKDGTVEQYCDSDVMAWTQAAGNSTWNGVETEGYPSEDLTIPQLSSLADIYRWGQTTYGWPLTLTDDPGGAGFGWHGMGGAAWGGHYGCPGDIRKAQRQTILDLVSPQPTTTGKNMIARDNVTGGTWVVRANASVYAFDGAPYLGPLPKYTGQWGIGTASNPIVGIVSDAAGGFILAADSGGAEPSTYHITKDGAYAR